MRSIWLSRALDDVGKIVRHIATDNPVAAKRLGRELLLAGDSLAMFPRRGRRGRVAGTRELAAVTPYLLVYKVAADDTVTILRVWHSAQDRTGRP